MPNSLENIASGCLAVVGGAALTAGGVFLAATGGAIFGAIGGEILDHVPYVRNAIPDGVAYLGNAFSDQDTTLAASEYLRGNLDKVGATMGFFGGYVRSRTTVKREPRESTYHSNPRT